MRTTHQNPTDHAQAGRVVPNAPLPAGPTKPPPTIPQLIQIAALAPGQTPLKGHQIFRLRLGLAAAREIKALNMGYEDTQLALCGAIGDLLELMEASREIRRGLERRAAEECAAGIFFPSAGGTYGPAPII